MFHLIVLLIFFLQNTYQQPGDVIKLTTQNFDDLVIRSNEPWMIEFFAPWCRYCKELEPEFSKAAKTLKNKVKFGAINGDEEAELFHRYNIQGMPTIYYFGVDQKWPIKYTGKRTAEELIQAALAGINKNS